MYVCMPCAAEFLTVPVCLAITWGEEDIGLLLRFMLEWTCFSLIIVCSEFFNFADVVAMLLLRLSKVGEQDLARLEDFAVKSFLLKFGSLSVVLSRHLQYNRLIA